jgi:hypothetical protein
MTNINKAVVKHWSLVRQGLSLPKDLQWPDDFGKGTLFGFLSDEIHQPSITTIYLGTKARPEVVSCFEYLAKRYDVSVEHVDEESAASGAMDSRN